MYKMYIGRILLYSVSVIRGLLHDMAEVQLCAVFKPGFLRDDLHSFILDFMYSN